MATPKKPKYRPSDIVNAERRYNDTFDPMFLALAVGAAPHLPPLWVIEECAKLVEKFAGYADAGNDQSKMGQRLDEMWRFFYATPPNLVYGADGRSESNKGPSVAAAARHALLVVDKQDGSGRVDAFEASMINLQRAWRAEASAGGALFPDIEVFDGIVSTPRSDRILKEYHDNEAGFPFRHVSLHIARNDRLPKSP